MSCFEDFMEFREEMENMRRKQQPEKSLGVRDEQTGPKEGCQSEPSSIQ